MQFKSKLYHSDELIFLNELLWSLNDVELRKINHIGIGDVKLCSRQKVFPYDMMHIIYSISYEAKNMVNLSMVNMIWPAKINLV